MFINTYDYKTQIINTVKSRYFLNLKHTNTQKLKNKHIMKLQLLELATNILKSMYHLSMYYLSSIIHLSICLPISTSISLSRWWKTWVCDHLVSDLEMSRLSLDHKLIALSDYHKSWSVPLVLITVAKLFTTFYKTL